CCAGPKMQSVPDSSVVGTSKKPQPPFTGPALQELKHLPWVRAGQPFLFGHDFLLPDFRHPLCHGQATALTLHSSGRSLTAANPNSWRKETTMKTRSHHFRPAFTMIELLVILGILVFVLGMLFPAIRQVQRAASRTQS